MRKFVPKEVEHVSFGTPQLSYLPSHCLTLVVLHPDHTSVHSFLCWDEAFELVRATLILPPKDVRIAAPATPVAQAPVICPLLRAVVFGPEVSVHRSFPTCCRASNEHVGDELSFALRRRGWTPNKHLFPQAVDSRGKLHNNLPAFNQIALP